MRLTFEMRKCGSISLVASPHSQVSLTDLHISLRRQRIPLHRLISFRWSLASEKFTNKLIPLNKTNRWQFDISSPSNLTNLPWRKQDYGWKFVKEIYFSVWLNLPCLRILYLRCNFLVIEAIIIGAFVNQIFIR